jgi:rhamnosyl/mannosyltransferase
VEQVIHTIAQGSIENGVFCDVLSLTSKEGNLIEDVDGYKIHNAHKMFEIASTGFSVDVISLFSRLAKAADIIHYHYPWPFMDIVHFLVRPNKPTVLTYHSDIVRQKNLMKLYRPLRDKFLSNVDVIVATSPNYLLSSEVLNRYREKVRVIPLGLQKEYHKVQNFDLLQKWRSKIGGKFFLFVGVLRYYKGLHILLDAAKNLNFLIVIVGSGPTEQALKNQASKLGLGNVIFLGAISDEDKKTLIELSYCVVFPSHLRSEAFGMTLLEGAAFGKPLISSEIGTGTSFVNIANETGIVIPPSDSFALRNAMQYLWDNPIEASRMGQAAQKRFRNNFTAEKMVESYVEVYNSLLY